MSKPCGPVGACALDAEREEAEQRAMTAGMFLASSPPTPSTRSLTANRPNPAHSSSGSPFTWAASSASASTRTTPSPAAAPRSPTSSSPTSKIAGSGSPGSSIHNSDLDLPPSSTSPTASRLSSSTIRFEIYIRRTGSDDRVLSFNFRGLFDFEQLRSKADGEDWVEKVRNHTDTRPHGPQSITLDVSFHGAV